MSTREVIKVLLDLRRHTTLSDTERAALERAISTLQAALGVRSWTW